MMTRKITSVALITGIVLGAATTEGFNIYRQSQESYRQSKNSRIFQERARCKAVADTYVKENTDLSDNNVTGRSVTLEKVDYSPARNSCVAELNTTDFAPGVGLEFYSVQDLLSGEALFTVDCNKGCIAIFLKKNWIDPAFDYVINNADEPVALEKEYALAQSELAPKSAPTSVTQWDAKGNSIPDSKHPPSGFIPGARASQHKSVQQFDPATGERIQVPTSKYPPK